MTIPAGATSAKVKIRFLDDGTPDKSRLLELALLPQTGTYLMRVPAQTRIHLIDQP